jgi:hypothetical protein
MTAIKKKSVAANPQLNRAKGAVTTGDLDSAMILPSVDLRIAQEIPKLSPRTQSEGKCEGQNPGNYMAVFQHGGPETTYVKCNTAF